MDDNVELCSSCDPVGRRALRDRQRYEKMVDETGVESATQSLRKQKVELDGVKPDKKE
jgi:hypothetical protein